MQKCYSLESKQVWDEATKIVSNKIFFKKKYAAEEKSEWKVECSESDRMADWITWEM